MSKRRSRNAARLGGSVTRPPSPAEQRRTSAQLQSERYCLGIATPEDDQRKSKAKAKKPDGSRREGADQHSTRSKKGSGGTAARPSGGRRVVSDSAPERRNGRVEGQDRVTDWKSAVLRVLAAGDWMTASEIVERIYTTRLSEELGRRGLVTQNPTEEVRRAIDQTNSKDSVIAKWRDPDDGAIRFSLGKKRPASNKPRPGSTTQERPLTGARRSRSPYSLLDAAELVLEKHADSKPLTIQAVISLALEHGYWETDGKTPANTLSARVGTEIKQRQSDDQPQRFTRPWRGYLGLATWETSDSGSVVGANASQAKNEPVLRVIDGDEIEMADEVAADAEMVGDEASTTEIDPAGTDADLGAELQPASEMGDPSDPEAALLLTTEVVNAVAKYLATLEPRDLIRCLTTYLAAIGAKDLTFAGGAGCFDISARGAIVAEGLFRRPLAVHVSPSIDYVVTPSDIAVCRGQAGTYDLALVIALGGFSPEARAEVQRSGTLPIEALDRTGFAQALFDLKIGVRIERIDTYEVGPYF